MKGFFAKTFSGRSITFWWIPLSFVAATRLASAAALQEARVSQVIQDVRLLEAHGAPRPAVVNDKLTLERAVRTGVQSRAELTFTDLTITRLGANTIFSLKAGAREVDLTSGTILLAVPTGRPPVKANTTSVTVAVTGGTALLATGPPLKFLVLEGTGTIYPKGHPEKAVTVHDGEMALMTMGGEISQPEQFDVKLVLETSALIVDFPPLANLPLILTVVNQQLAAQQMAGATNQPLAKNFVDVVDVTDQNANSNPVVLVSTSGSSPTTPPTTTPPPTTPPPTTPPPTTPPPTTPPPTTPPPTTPPPTPTTPPPTPTTPPPTPTTPPPTPTTPPPTPTTPPPTPTTPPPTPTTPPPTPTTPPPTPTTPPPTPTTPPPTPTTPPPTPTPPTPTPPPPTPSKFGTPTTIASPVPYLITSGTTISTDPSITTNGVTDYGKIYRSSTDDGAFSLWAFGSTSAFDTALKIDSEFFADPNHLPIAVFKFQSLSLIGNPIIDTSNGGVTNLGLIGVDGITSGPPGGTLTFTGLDLLVLATVNGPINLTSDVSFQDLNGLAMYARGAGSDLTIDSPISNIGILDLAAEGSIQLTNPGTMSVGALDATAGNNLTLQIGGSLSLDGRVRLNTLVLPGTTVASGGNLTLNVTGDYTNSSPTEFSRLQVTNEGAHIGTGGNITVNIDGNVTATGLGSATEFPEPGDFEAVVQNTNGQIDNGGNLNLTMNGNVQVNGLVAYLQNYDETANPAGHIGTGGNIDIQIGGNLTANSYVDVFLNNRGGGMIDSGGNLTFNVSGALNIGADAGGGAPDFSAEFIVSTRYDAIMGNTTPSFIGSDVSLLVHAASVSMAGTLFGSGISNRGGSIIDGNATATWDVPGNVNIQGTGPNSIGGLNGANWWVLNDIPTESGAPPSGGTIHGNATVTLNIGGDLTVAGDGEVFIANQRTFSAVAPTGGSIDSDATLNVTAANFSVGGVLDVEIDNFISGSSSGTGGSIGGNAAINLNLFGNLIATGSDPNSGGIPGDAYFQILNHSSVSGSPGGFIGGDATIDLNIINASIAGLFDVEIDNHNGGTIGGNATIDVSAANVTANSLLAQIDNTGGTIGGNASVNVGLSGNINIVGDASFQILNNDGGHIGTGGNISVTTGAGGDFTANSVIAFVNNHNGGTIDSGANITFNIGGALTTTGDAIFVVSNLNDGTGGGTIGSLATVDINAASISVGGFFQTFSGANGGGSIQGDAINTVTTSGDLTAQQGILLNIADTAFGSNGVFTGGHIGGNAIVTLSAQNIITPSTATGVPGTDTMALEASIYSDASGTVGGDALVNVSATQDISAPGTVFFSVANGNFMDLGPGTVGGDAQINVTAANLSTGALFDDIYNYGGGSIGGDAIISLNLSNTFTATGNAEFLILNPGGTITRNGSISITAGDISAPSLIAEINNSSSGLIGGNATINLNLTGNITTQGDANLQINNRNVSGSGGGAIGGVASVNVTTDGDISTQGTAFFAVLNDDEGNGGGGGTIGSDATVNVNAANISSGPSLDWSLLGLIDNRGGNIGGNATVNLSLTGDLTTQSDARFQIYNFGDGGNSSGAIGGHALVNVSVDGDINSQGIVFSGIHNDDGGYASGGGTIVGETAIDMAANNITATSFGETISNAGGSIGGSANLTLNLTGDLTTTQSGTEFDILNNDDGSGSGGGVIGTDATVNVNLGNLTSGPDVNSNALIEQIDNRGGNIGGNATVNFTAFGNVNAQGNAILQVLNDNDGASGPGTIGGDATLDVSAASFSTAGLLQAQVDNRGGSIGNNAFVGFNVFGNVNTQGNALFQIYNQNDGISGPGSIGGNAAINVSAANMSTQGFLYDTIDNSSGSSITGTANIAFSLTGGLTTQGDATFQILNYNNGSGGGAIGGDASLSVNVGGDINAQGNATFRILNDDGFNATGAGTIVGNAAVNVNANSISTDGSLSSYVNTFNGSNIGGTASISFTVTGNLTTLAATDFRIDNSNGASIGSGATINVSSGNISTGDYLNLIIFNNDNGSGGGTIGSDALITVNTTNLSPGGSFNFFTMDNGGGNIGGNASITFNLTGDLTSPGQPVFGINNSNAGTIVSDATISLSANSISSGGTLQAQIGNQGGNIGGDAAVSFNLGGDLTSSADMFFAVDNSNGGTGTIGGNATVDVSAGNISANSFNAQIFNAGDGSIGLDANIDVNAVSISTVGGLSSFIGNNNHGDIVGSALLNFNLSGDINSQSGAEFYIFNDSNGNGGGSIGGDAMINVSANNISIGSSLFAQIANPGGNIGGSAVIDFNASGAVDTADANFHISNGDYGDGGGPGTIGGNATINISAAGITANSLVAQIDNTGGSIGGAATINMNVSGNATVTNDATVAIYNSDGAASAAINFTNGSYDAGGTFTSYIDGNGTMTFNNASLHADVLKVGVFGANGVLNIGGGTLSADTTLKLYAPGSNGQLNFVSNVTLGGNSAKILAANTITIFNNVTVTINGPTPADVYTNNANYSSVWGGNGSTTGTFAGTAGANSPQPLSNAPAFDDPPPPVTLSTTTTKTSTTLRSQTLSSPSGTTTTTIKSPTLSTAGGTRNTKIASTTLSSPKPTSTKTDAAAINVSNTDQLLSLLDGAAPGSDGKITISNSKNGNSNSKNTSSNSSNSSRMNANAALRADRAMADIRHTRDRSVMNSRLGGGARPQ